MNRADKVRTVDELKQTFSDAPHMLVATFRGLSVNQATVLRSKIRDIGGSCRVIQNRLAKRAAEGTPAQDLAQIFNGPCALATHQDDPVVLAKTLAEFIKDNPQLEVLGGLVDAKSTIDAGEFKDLSSMPGALELRAQLLALINTPATTLVRLINTPATQLGRVVDARRENLKG